MKEKQLFKVKERTVIGPYGIEVVVPITRIVKDFPLAGHGMNECGRHYNIFEKDDGFPQSRFYPESSPENIGKE